ncbi:hypothetical protein MJO28_017467 [Puccinia striiformis f. sp. tritici]|nr:hypothetical protein MJO28_017467 [Puccinia striiformis f. sp. tritici]
MSPVTDLKKLIQLQTNKNHGISNSLRKRLQATIYCPPQSEPSFRETRERWMRILERQRIENMGIVALELEKRDKEVHQLSMLDGSHLWKHLDSIRAFLLELHSSPSLESYNLAQRYQSEENEKLQVETQAEMDQKLYQAIMEEELLVGDHWQTDIYAGSSSSLSDSTPSSDWNSDSEEGHDHPDPVSDPDNNQDLLISGIHGSDSRDNSADRPVSISISSPGFQKLEEFRRDAYWLKTETEISNTQLPELIALREVIAALLNVGGGLIYSSTATQEEVKLSENVPTLLDKSRTTTLSLLSSFLPILSSLKKLRNLAQPIDDHNHGRGRRRTRTEEAFAASVLILLQQFDIFLTSIELQLLNLPGGHTVQDRSLIHFQSVISLIRLYHRLDQNGWIELYTALSKTIPDSSIHHPISSKLLLDNLYRIACHFDSHCKSIDAIHRIKTVFLRGCGPIWRWVGEWMMDGRLSESTPTDDDHGNQEFFIGITPNVGPRSENWWEDHYFLNESNIPEFLYDFVGDILEAGKATALSRILGIIDQQDLKWPKLDALFIPTSSPLPSTIQPINILKSHLRHLAFSSSSSHHPQPIPSSISSSDREEKSSFHLDLYAHINQLLSPLVTKNHSKLYTRFSSPLKLSTYLNELNQFYLLGSKTSIHFIKKVFNDLNESKSGRLNPERIDQSPSWFEDQVLNSNLSKSFEYSPSPIISSCLPKVKLSSPSDIDTEDQFDMLGLIKISLSIPSPLNYIIDNLNILNSYNKCFDFLIQLTRSSQILDSMIWIKPVLTMNSSSKEKGGSLSIKEFESKPESKQFYKLKNRLNWFINLMIDYSFNLVIFNWKLKVVEALDVDHVGDLSQTIQHTRRWLSRLIGLLFLSDQCEPLNRTIIQILQLCPRSYEVWSKLNNQATEGVKSIEDVNETYVDTERRRRRIERRKRRLENEQYTLIEEESKHVDLGQLAALLQSSIIDDEQDDIDLKNLSSFTSPADTTHINLQESINPQKEDCLNQLTNMNTQFEKLVISLQRGIGKLCRKVVINKDLNKTPSSSLDSSSHHKNVDPVIHQEPSHLGLEDSQDLDTLTLLECRLDEWVT